MFTRSFARPVALALALAFGASPLVASADEAHGKAEAVKVVHPKKVAKHFPVKAGHFEKAVAVRIEQARLHLDRMIAEARLPEHVARQIRRDFEGHAASIRALARRCEADGKVTREEAKEVNDLAKSLERRAEERYHLGHGKLAHR
jgi:hypothetical protein